MSIEEFLGKFLAELLLKTIMWLFDEIDKTDYASNVSHALQEKAKRLGAAKTLPSAISSFVKMPAVAAWLGPAAGILCIFVTCNVLDEFWDDLPLVNSWLLSYIATHDWAVYTVLGFIGFAGGIVGAIASGVLAPGSLSRESSIKIACLWLAFTFARQLIIDPSSLLHPQQLPASLFLAVDFGVLAACYLVTKFSAAAALPSAGHDH